ncbi:MAG: beta,4-xylanase [Clostridia bacterium]|jgi:hypothetical protein|nr:beta,4-xylanase [Clostridia bacterium]
MKKVIKMMSILIALIMVVTFSMTSFGASTEILKGTPVIDGKIDEIYSQSLAIPIGEGTEGVGFYSTGASTDTDLSGTVYLLWDDKFLYACADVKDGDVLSAGDEYINAEANPWINDATEHWIDLLTGAAIKISTDAFAKRVFGNNDTDFDFVNVSKAATQGNGGYITEIAIPLSVAVKEGDELGYKIQVNDYAADATVVALSANYGEGNQGVVYYKLGKAVVMPEPEPEPEVVETVKENAETSDISEIYYIFAAFLSLGLIVFIKSAKIFKKEISTKY